MSEYTERELSQLEPGVLLYELFLEWGLVERPNLQGWELYRMHNEKRWLSHNAMQGMLDEFTSVTSKRGAATGVSPATPLEGYEAPLNHGRN